MEIIITKVIKMKNRIIIGLLLIGMQSYAQNLEEYIQIAKANNSKIKVARANLKLVNEKQQEVAHYDNTNFSFGGFAWTPETRVGAQLFKAGASQKLPWIGEFKAQKESVNALAEIKSVEVFLSELDIAYAVKKSYFELYQQRAIAHILNENKQILKTYEVMALAALENNRATMSDVLRIQVQKNELHRKIVKNRNNLEILKENFNRLLQRDKTIPLHIPDSLPLLDTLRVKLTVNQHPVLQKISKKERLYKAEKELINGSKQPKISLGLDYILVAKRSDASPIQNGKDILMPRFSLSIPLFNKKKYQSKLNQVQIKENMLKDEFKAQQIQLEIAIAQAKLDIDNALVTVLTAQENKTMIQRAIDVDLKAFETGILDYDKILQLQLQKIRFQLMEVEAIKKVYIAKAKVSYLSDS